MRILVVDDDHLETEKIVEAVGRRFDAHVDVISTESEFVSKMEGISGEPPNVIILDIMLRWADPSPDLRPEDVPEEVRREGFYTAGLRCLRLLSNRQETKRIPVILYTTLDQNDFKEHVVHTKTDDLEPLLEEIRRKTAS